MLNKGLGKFLGRMLLQLFNLASKPNPSHRVGFFSCQLIGAKVTEAIWSKHNALRLEGLADNSGFWEYRTKSTALAKLAMDF